MTHFKNWKRFQYLQVILPLLPIPLGSYFLYKALESYNRAPPPIAQRASRVLDGPIYGEPVYKRIDFRPSTIASNAVSRYR
mmetsp:Transcript_22244/g.56377  ORF Transcript_22244/g.56377 Transcript_22244/m.56377 type:complete len:81 (-) Transcript_22244:337-579(-)